jgi:ABC-type cobalamin/Fe3+-siderophores transport system ATPase subunit
LRRLEVVGGMLDGLCLDLADGLNCIIGGFGTGKTTVLELVRYALEQQPHDAHTRNCAKSLIEGNLDGGRVILTVETAGGLTYTISRTIIEPARIVYQDHAHCDLPKGSLFTAQVYSLREIQDMAEDPAAQLALLDSFSAQGVAAVNAAIEPIRRDLKLNATSMLDARRQADELAAEVATIPVAEQKIAEFSRGTSRSVTAINQAFEDKTRRDRQAAAALAAGEMLASMREHVVEMLRAAQQDWRPRAEADLVSGGTKMDGGAAGGVWRPRAEADLVSGEDGRILAEMLAAVADAAGHVTDALKDAQARLEQASERMLTAGRRLDAEHSRREVKFREMLEKQNLQKANARERANWERTRNALLLKKRRLEDLHDRIATLQTQRGELLDRLGELRRRRFDLRRNVAESINLQVALSSIRVSIVRSGNREPLRELLEESLRGSDRGTMKHRVVARKLIRLDPAELVQLVRQADEKALMARAEINANQAACVIRDLSAPEVLLELEVLELPDLPRIELLHGTVYKDSARLSPGHRCTAILPILLLDSSHPLLIDEPEGNLNNAFVYHGIVQTVAEVKTRRQLLFVTHNANIPVLGDADRMFVLESDGQRTRLAGQGTVDDCREDILSLLEGGQEAFERRRQRYECGVTADDKH